MTVSSTGTYSSGKAWVGSKSKDVELGAKTHAEIDVYGKLLDAMPKGKGKLDLATVVFYFKQNAFPCSECMNYFIAQSNSRNFIFVCTEDQGDYSKDWGLTAPPLPQAIYLRGGSVFYPGRVTATVVTKAPAPGAGANTKWVSTETKVTTMNAINPQTCQRPEGFPSYPTLT